MGPQVGRLGVWAVILTFAAGGCALQRPVPDDAASGFNAGAVQNWRLSARLAMSNGRDGGSGQLEWEQRGERAELRFHGAFGRRGWRLLATPEESILDLPTGERFSAPRVEDLVREHVGWEVPLDALRYWVRGQVAPDAPARTRHDRSGRLALIQQHRWRVEYEGHLEIGGTTLPRKITANRDGNRIRLLIKRWTIDSQG